jgi:uncharacterized protein YdeI (YjbR/CyaY-like superfamily)
MPPGKSPHTIITLRVPGLEEWGKWLGEHHDTEDGVWLVFRKKSSGPVPFTYGEALDEALCHGWVDSLIKAIDHKEYMRKFTPRTASSTWSATNKDRVEQLIAQGRMTPAGMAVVEAAKKNGMWDRGVERPEFNEETPAALLEAFETNPAARDNYYGMKHSHRRQYNIWINMAKREETVQRRVEESLRLLERGKELGLK